jgi:ribose transport system permease protein
MSAERQTRPARSGVQAALAAARERDLLRAAVPVGVLLLVVVALQMRDTAFLTTQTLTSLAGSATPILLLTAGLTLVILIGGFDLSVAAMASFASVLLARWVPDHGWLGLALVLVVATAFGALQGWVHAVTQVPSFVVTLGGLGILTGLSLRLSDASTQQIDGHVGVIDWLGDEVAGVPASFLVALAVLALLALALRVLPFGRQLMAVGSAEPAALLSGVRTVRVRVAAFALSSLCAALAGVALSAETGFGSPTLGSQLLLPTVAAVVVGGTAISGGVGGLWAALLGGLIVTTVQVGTTFVGFDPAVQQVIFGVTIVVAVGLTTDRRKIGVIK